MKKIILIAALLLGFAAPVLAQVHAHGEKGPNGGSMQDVAGVHAELMVVDRTLTIHVYDEAGKTVPTTGFSGSILVGSGQARQVVQLTPGAGNTLVGTATASVARGAQMTLQLKTSGGKSGQAKF